MAKEPGNKNIGNNDGRNPLFFNFERPIGKQWKNTIMRGIGSASYTQEIYCGKIHVFHEALVPSQASGDVLGLTNLANSIYAEARRFNMSLAAYGHLDPIKFCIACVYPSLMLLEIKRNLGIACKYEFGNVAYGRGLASALNFDFNDAVTNYTHYAKLFNQSVERLNSIMIPEMDLFKAWAKHRVTLYKDDEGDRYQFFAFKMANYYELDVNPSSPTVGQLLCKWVPKYASGSTPKLSDLFTLLNTILDNYVNDDDFVSFCTEAIKAGMSHFVMDKIPCSSEEYARVELSIEYDLDTVYSVTNAKMVRPVELSGNTASVTGHWNIYEDTSRNQLLVGFCGGYTGNRALPILNPIIDCIKTNNSVVVSTQMHPSFSDTPIFTHAKKLAEDGKRSLTKYLNAMDTCNLQAASSGINYWYHRGEMVTLPADLVTNPNFCALHTHSDTIIVDYTYVYQNVGLTFTAGYFRWFYNITNSAFEYNTLFSGTKFKPYLFYASFTLSGTTLNAISVYEDLPDYDYITAISADSLNAYFAKEFWDVNQLV